MQFSQCKQQGDSISARSEKKKKRDRAGHHSAKGPGFGIHERRLCIKKKKKKDTNGGSGTSQERF